MDSRAKKSGLAFFVAVSLGVPAIVLLADVMLDQGVTITPNDTALGGYD